MSESNGPALSKNLAFAAVAIIIMCGVIGVVLLSIFRPDATATFINTIVTFAGLLTATITLLRAQAKATEQIEVVQRQTNGTLSALREENARLQAEKVDLARQLPPAGE